MNKLQMLSNRCYRNSLVHMDDQQVFCLNVSNFLSGKHKKSFQDPYRRAPGGGPGTNNFHLKVCKYYIAYTTHRHTHSMHI